MNSENKALIKAVKLLLACPDLNLEELEQETLDAIKYAQGVLEAIEGK